MPASSLDALLTKRYGQWKKPVAQKNTFLKSLPFVASTDKSGKDFSMPILSAISQGVTPDNTGGIVTLNGARSGKNNQATLDGVNLYIQENLSYSDLMKMDNGSSEDGSAPSYESGPDWTMFSMRLGLKHHAEIMALYGAGTTATMSSDIGVIFSTPVSSGGPNYNSGTPPVVILTTASWSKLLWLNSGSGGDTDKGMLVDVYQSNGTTLRASKIRIVGVANSQKCQVTMAATAGSTNPGAAVTAGDRIVPTGWVGASAVGISGQMQTVGNFAGIDSTLVPQWQAVNFDCGGTALAPDMFQNFMSKLTGNGFDEGEFDVWGAPPALSNLINWFQTFTKRDVGANRDKVFAGSKGVTIDTPSGSLTFKGYGYLKQGEIIVVAKGHAVRIGASEGREKGIQGTGLALELPTQSGSEMRAMMQFAPLLTVPFWSGRMFNFIPAAGAGNLAYDYAAV